MGGGGGVAGMKSVLRTIGFAIAAAFTVAVVCLFWDRIREPEEA